MGRRKRHPKYRDRDILGRKLPGSPSPNPNAGRGKQAEHQQPATEGAPETLTNIDEILLGDPTLLARYVRNLKRDVLAGLPHASARFEAALGRQQQKDSPFPLQFYLSGMDLTRLTADERRTLHDLIGKADTDVVTDEELEERRVQFEAAERGERPQPPPAEGYYERRGQAPAGPEEFKALPVVVVQREQRQLPAPEPTCPDEASEADWERWRADGYRSAPSWARPQDEGVAPDLDANDGYGPRRSKWDMSNYR